MTKRDASSFRNGGDRIAGRVSKNRLLDLLASWEPLEEGFPEIEDAPPQMRDCLDFTWPAKCPDAS